MRISDWSSDVCSSDLGERVPIRRAAFGRAIPDGDAGQRAELFLDIGEAHRIDRRFGDVARRERRSGGNRSEALARQRQDRKRVVKGTGVSVSVNLGGRSLIKQKQKI